MYGTTIFKQQFSFPSLYSGAGVGGGQYCNVALENSGFEVILT